MLSLIAYWYLHKSYLVSYAKATQLNANKDLTLLVIFVKKFPFILFVAFKVSAYCLYSNTDATPVETGTTPYCVSFKTP